MSLDPTTWEWDPTQWSAGGATLEEGANNLADWVTGDVMGGDQAKDTADKIAAAAKEDAQYSHPNVNGVLGSQTVTRNPDGTVNVNTSLSDQQNSLLQGLYGDAGTSRQRIEDALYSRSTARLDPQWNDREDASRTKLYNMGLTEGDAAYDREARNLGMERNDAYAQARNNAVAYGGQEQSRIIDAIMKAANPGLAGYYGENNATNSAIAQGNVLAQSPTGLDAILGIVSAYNSGD